jgi:hypothetical protein
MYISIFLETSLVSSRPSHGCLARSCARFDECSPRFFQGLSSFNNGIAPNRNLKLVEVKWGDVAHSENPELTMSNGQRCRPIAWYSTAAFVLDSASGPQIAILEAAAQAQQMVAEMKQKSMSITISGRRRSPRSLRGEDPACVPELIWAWDAEATDTSDDFQEQK